MTLPFSAVVIAGPTASGKTALALELAAYYKTEIISADSMQFYRGMEIGTAAPTEGERIRIPHHFVGCLNPNEHMSAGLFQQQARNVVKKLNERGLPAIIVGGSGLYLQSLVDGLFEGPSNSAHIRKALYEFANREGNNSLFARLESVDPAYAAQLTSPNDLVRIVRALEVWEMTRKPFSTLHREHQARLQPLSTRWYGLSWERQTLYHRIDTRVIKMMEAGWLDEVKRLIEAGFTDALYRLKALGYREMYRYLAGDQSLEEAIEATQKHHRRLAKRQLTWFRSEGRIQWLRVDESTTVPMCLDSIMHGLEG